MKKKYLQLISLAIFDYSLETQIKYKHYQIC